MTEILAQPDISQWKGLIPYLGVPGVMLVILFFLFYKKIIRWGHQFEEQGKDHEREISQLNASHAIQLALKESECTKVSAEKDKILALCQERYTEMKREANERIVELKKGEEGWKETAIGLLRGSKEIYSANKTLAEKVK